MSRMSPLRARGSRAPAAWAVLWLTVLVSLAIALPAVGAAAAPVTWLARVGAAGANGQAAIVAPDAAGTVGSLKLSLKGLTARTTYPVKVQAGTCASPGAALFTAPSQKSSSAGKISKVVPVAATKMDAIRSARSLILRVGSGSKLRCGPFTGGPPVTTTPTPLPSPSPSLAARIDLDDIPMDISASSTSVWVAEMVGNTLERVDTTANRIAQRVVMGEILETVPLGVAVGVDAVWVTGTAISPTYGVPAKGTLRRVDPASGKVVATIDVGSGPGQPAIGPTGVWIAVSDGTVRRIDPSSNAIAWSAKVANDETGIAVGMGSVWIADGSSNAVIRLDEATGAVVATIPVRGKATHVAVGAGSVWAGVDGATDTAVDRIVRIDPVTNGVVATIEVGGYLRDVVPTDTFV
ncbi:MAG: glutaminyl-peptide cyclotransferase, partial [Chloroflexi bacterium]|nr:glutaminyl-peptide cyclotransferase [Chloroflexota bacterium]